MFLLFSQKYNKIVVTHSDGYHLTQLQILQQENKENFHTNKLTQNLKLWAGKVLKFSVYPSFFSNKAICYFPPLHEISVVVADWNSFRAHCSYTLWKHQLILCTLIQSSADWIQLKCRNPIWQTAALCCLALKQTLIVHWGSTECFGKPAFSISIKP